MHITDKIMGVSINEAAWDENDFINAIMGSCEGEPAKMRGGLQTLKKSVLKKLYAHLSGKSTATAGDQSGPVDTSVEPTYFSSTSDEDGVDDEESEPSA